MRRTFAVLSSSLAIGRASAPRWCRPPTDSFNGGEFTPITLNGNNNAKKVEETAIAPETPAESKMVAGNAAIQKSLFTKCSDFDIANQPTGSAACDRVCNNINRESNPYSASTMEIRVPQKNKVVSTRKKKIDFRKLAARKYKLAQPELDRPQEEDGLEVSPLVGDTRSMYHSAEKIEEDLVEIVFTYETSDDPGLVTFRMIAERVKNGTLPGRLENTTAVGGFAQWIVSRKDYLAMLATKPQLE